ncbi:MAG: hypothetical protein Q9180_006179 [Flavoplaca navasiana]
MANVANSPGNTTHDVGSIWQMAIDQYEAITTTKLHTLARANNVDEILSEIREEDTKFKTFRHDGSRADKFRSLVSRSLRPLEVLSQITGEAASSSANAVSADYEKIAGFFEDLDMYLHRLKVLEEHVPRLPEIELVLIKVFTSVLTLCGISAKYIKMRRIVKAFRNLGTGEDDELTAAYTYFHKMVEQEAGAVRNATLAGVEQLKLRAGDIYSDVQQGLATMDITNEKYAVLGEVAAERDDILKAISTLNFRNKQRDVYEKHHHGTGIPENSTDHPFTNWSLVVNYIGEEIQGNRSGLAYVYCDYKDTSTQSAVGLLSSMIQQLAEQVSPLPPEVKAFRDNDLDKRRNPTDDERLALLKSMCSYFQDVYICVDALV